MKSLLSQLYRRYSLNQRATASVQGGSFSKYKGSIKANILIVAVWGTVIVTGFLALGAIVGNIEGLIVFSGIHSLAVRLGLAYTAVHIFRHRKQIMLRFGVEIGSSKQAENERLKNNRAVKGITAIVFHILLHMVSIHLAVAYTLFHIVQHRHSIFSPFKKLSFRNNATLNRSLQSVRLTPSIQAIPLAA